MNLNDLRAHAYGAASGKENDTSNGAHSNTENERNPQKPLFRDVNAQMDSIFRSSKKLSREEHPNIELQRANAHQSSSGRIFRAKKRLCIPPGG